MRSITTLYLDLDKAKIPLSIYGSNDNEKPRFKSIHRDCLKPVRMPKTCVSCDKEVSSDELIKGFEVSKGSFVYLTKEEINKTASDIVSVLSKIQLSKIPLRLFKGKHYFLGVKSAKTKSEESRINVYKRVLQGLKAYLEQNDLGLIVRYYLRDSESIGLIHYSEGDLILSNLYLNSELREFDKREEVLKLESKEKEVLDKAFYDLASEKAYSSVENVQNNLIMKAIEVKMDSGEVPEYQEKAKPEEIGGGIIGLFT